MSGNFLMNLKNKTSNMLQLFISNTAVVLPPKPRTASGLLTSFLNELMHDSLFPFKFSADSSRSTNVAG